ncbi:MAG: hypothetical protein KBS60_00785, partial [Phascolarctobacterium sp.]|nr:hypothetical protein [Candidatus Phascolarctobacterium caballi]
IVNINNSTFGGNFQANGGSSSGLTSTTLNNAVNVTGSTFNGTATICGSRAASGNTTSGTVSVTDSTFNGNTEIYGNSSLRGNVSGGNIIIDNDVFHNQTAIYGGYQKFDEYSAGGNVSGGSVTVKEYTCFYGDTNIVGSYAGGGDRGTGGGNASGGEVTIDYAYFRDGSSVEISGGFGMDTASGNKVTINDIDFYNITNCRISAGVAGSEISGNELTINSGDFTGVTILNIYGGNGDTPTMSNNIITINGGKFSSDSTKLFEIYAGDSGAGTGTGNVLNINTCVDGIVNYLYYPQNINFKAPSGMDTNLPMLSLRNAVALAGVNIDVDISNISLAEDEFIMLIDNVDSEGYTPANAHYQLLTLDNSKYFLVYSGGTDPITATPDYTVTADGTTYKSDKFRGTYNTIINGTDYTAKITGNKMDIAGGTYKKDVYAAGGTESTGDYTVSTNTLNIESGNFESNDYEMNIAGGYGKYSGSGKITVSGNELNISGGNFTRSNLELRLIGGGIYHNADGSTINVSNNTLKVSGGTYSSAWDGCIMELNGGYVHMPNTNKHPVSFTADNNTAIFGAEDVEKISVVENSVIEIHGVFIEEGDSGGCDVNASNNIVSVLSDTDKAALVSVSGVFSQYGSKLVADNNVVNIGKSDGTTVFENMKFWGIIGAGCFADNKELTDNTLNVNAKISVTGEVKGFQKMNFTLPAGFGASDVMMTVGGTVYFDNTVVDINDGLPDGFVVVKGSTITLISASGISGNYSAGANISNLGTLNKQDNKLYISLLDGPIVAKDLTVDVQVNSGDALVLIGNDADNILAKTIRGEGGVQIGNGTDAAEVQTSAANLTVGGNIEVKTNAGLVITDGKLQQKVTNGGKVDMVSGSSFGTNATITGGEVYLKSGVEFSKDNLSGVSLLDLTDAVYNLSATLNGSTVTLDQIGATNVRGTLSLGDITLSGSGLTAGTTYQASYITGTPASLTVSGTSAVTYDGQTYIFSQGYNTAGDSGSGEKAGTLDIFVEGKVYTLKEIINGDTRAGFDPAKIETYVMTEDYIATATGSELGALTRASEGTARTLTIDGDGTHKILGYENTYTGIVVNDGDTLTLQDIAEISGWKSYAVDNSGTVNFAGTVTLGTNAVMQGNGSYNNDGTLTTSANNLQMTSPSGLKNNGTLILTDGTLTAEITGTGTITVDGEVTTANIGLVSSTETLAVSENGIFELTGSTLDRVIANKGTVKLNGAGLDGAYVTAGTLEFAQDLETNANYVAADTNIVDKDVTLTLTGGNLAKEVTGAGGITFNGNVSTDADNIKTTGTNMVNSGKTLTLTGDGKGDDTLTVAIGGGGNIVFAGDITTESGNIQTTDGATVSTTGSLHLSGGNLETIIGGAGDIYIDGDVSSDAGYLQGDKMTVSDSST